MGLASAIGVLTGVFGVIWPLIPQGRPNRVSTDIKISPQGAPHNPTDSHGFWPSLYFWDEQNALIGWDLPNKFWGDAAAVLKYTTSTYGDRVPKWIQVQGDPSQSVCVTRVTYNNAMDDKMGTIIGNLWEGCNQRWYHSTDDAGTIRLQCGWLGDPGRGFARTVKFDSHFFQTGRPEHQMRDLGDRVCHPPYLEFTANAVSRGRFDKRSVNETSILAVPNSQLYPKIRPEYVVFGNRSATDLCDSLTSFGPHFYSTTENVLCNMTTKTLSRDFYPASSAKRGIQLVELRKWDGKY